MRNPEIILDTLSSHSKVSDYKYERIYRILFNEEMFMLAYERIKSKPGNMTPGTDGLTIDGMTIDRIGKLIECLKDESYSPKPAKRVYIPKKNGKKRPLGIPTIEDKLVQEVTRMILEAMYEGHFESTSHGFRPFKSCHTALISIKKTFTGMRWFIEGDIKGFFDNIHHATLIDILRMRIADERFIRLIWKFLRAGYLEEWYFNKTYSGTPQGGIVSPILANIYLDQFDKYMKEYATLFDKGESRKIRNEYMNLNMCTVNRRKKRKATEDPVEAAALDAEIKQLQKQLRSMPVRDEMDENYRRLKYVRYADDFLIGVIGSKQDCERIKEDITNYMRDRLKLELSAEKTLITHAREEAKFLGYRITVKTLDVMKRNCKGILSRAFRGKVQLLLSSETVKDKLMSYGAVKFTEQNGKTVWLPQSRSYLIGMESHQILAKFNLEIRGFYNYYCIADNVSATCSKLGYIMQYSLYKTLAQKLNSTMPKIVRKYRKDKEFKIEYTDKKGNQKYRVLYNGGFAQKQPNKMADCDNLPHVSFPKRSLAERLRSEICELCGRHDKLIMHHVRTLKSINDKTEWGKIMLGSHRKTIAVCESCYTKIKEKEHEK